MKFSGKKQRVAKILARLGEKLTNVDRSAKNAFSACR